MGSKAMISCMGLTLRNPQRDESSTHAKIVVRHVKDPYQKNGRNISGRNK